jgi:predicted amidohydrolase
MPLRIRTISILAAVSAALSAQDGWTEASPRDEIRPKFLRTGEGRSGRGSLVIEGDGREGLDGYWRKQFPVAGGQVYRFSGYRKASRLEWPQQNAPARIRWLDAEGKRVIDDRPLVNGYLNGFTPWAPGEFPVDTGTVDRGWTLVTGSYRAPATAREAIVELHLQWTPRGRIEWSDIDFTQAPEPAPRIVKLAAAHLQPRSGKTPAEKCMLYEPLIQQAAEKGADLIVLGETVNYYDTGRDPAAVAEPIPGPSTDCFSRLARKHATHIVVSLYERDRHLVYNAGVLITPSGQLAGKYRKVSLPEGEVESGVAPGDAYPVFDTKFGRLGIMICYDGFFPEVASELTKRGAEVIAWPVWGVNPDLAKARAAENHVYIVSSTYESVPRNWGLSAVWDHAGRTVSVAQDWGTIAFAEVDLNSLTRWRSLGDFRSRLPRHMPLVRESPQFEPVASRR